MCIRCSHCHGPVWVDVMDVSASGELLTMCSSCGQDYRFDASVVSGKALESLHEEARECARKRRMDLPGAYSVVLGLMDQETVREVERSARRAHLAAGFEERSSEQGSRRRAPGGLERRRGTQYDRAFDEAVRSGRLTVLQAVQRGSREQYAQKIADAHGLPLSAAYSVADNKMSLLEALRTRRRPREITVQVENSERPAGRTMPVIATVLTLLIVSAVGAGLFLSDDEAGQTGPTAGQVERPEEILQQVMWDSSKPAEFAVSEDNLERTERVGDRTGRTVRIAGPDPESVLSAYCASDASGDLKPVTVVRFRPSVPRAVAGIYRDEKRSGAFTAIRLQLDPESGRWFVGNGEDPVSETKVFRPVPR